MSFRIDKGLALLALTDYHAILGVPIGASFPEIRKRYLKVTRSLHPDSCEGAYRDLANQLLAKMVNPAYEIFEKEKDRVDYEAILRIAGQRLANDNVPLSPTTDLARQLLNAPQYDDFYQQSIYSLAEQQFRAIDCALAVMGQLSELNMVYLQRREGKAVPIGRSIPSVAVAPSPAMPPVATNRSMTTPPTQPMAVRSMDRSAPPQPSSQGAKETDLPSGIFVKQYLRRAEELMVKNCHQQAIMELREALKLEPQSSRSHSLLGTVYLALGQNKMAKVHFTQALKLDSQDLQAMQGQEKLAKLEQKAAQKAQKLSTPAKPENKGGLFGLFGGKKK